MSINQIVKDRGIKEILHFTTNRGCLGVLATQSLKARQRLGEDKTLEFILQLNAEERSRDKEWHDYVSMSISRINSKFFKASGSWHKEKDIWWCILSFSPEILSHPSVSFATTNNMYSGVKRATGREGLTALFAPSIVQWHSSFVTREVGLPSDMTTCMQAEALYPGEVSTEFLQAIYVSEDAHAEEVAGQMEVVGHAKRDIVVAPERFEEFR